MCQSYRRIRNVRQSSFLCLFLFCQLPKVGKHSQRERDDATEVLTAVGARPIFFNGAGVFAGFGGTALGERVEFGQQGDMHRAVLFVCRRRETCAWSSGSK
jgi:hypothetical protein